MDQKKQKIIVFTKIMIKIVEQKRLLATMYRNKYAQLVK